MNNKSLKKSNRRFPAEWEKQQGILLCFPHNGNDWPGKFGAVQWAFVEFIEKITAHETVFLIVKDSEQENKVAGKLSKTNVDLNQIQFIHQKTNRSWMRDSGPIMVRTEKGREALNFNFNGWAKYSNYCLDKNIPQAVAQHLKIPLTQVLYQGKPVTLEGGSIEVNGKGTLLTTEECLLHPHIQVRNSGFTKSDYEAIFETFLGVKNTIWLNKGIVGDDTHGHIDDLARFVDETTIVAVEETNQKDKNYALLQENWKRLKSAKLENGTSPEIVRLPMPKPIVFEGTQLPASYANFLILNKLILVPTFNDANDRIALNILADCFPNREVIGISATDLIWGLGTLHCLSQQVPKSL